MIIKLFSCILLCLSIPSAIANSQRRYVNNGQEKVVYDKKIPHAKVVKSIREKEAENMYLEKKIIANKQEINELLAQLIEKKTVKKKPIYKRIFVHRNKKKVLPGIITDPVPVKMDTGTVGIHQVDTVAVVMPAVPKKQNFFKRLFNKVFKNKK